MPSSAGVAEAFRTTAAASGQLSSLNVYVSGSSTAGSIIGGLYTDAGGTPGTLLAQGSAAAPAGGWRSVPLPSPVAVSVGATYWIAVLAPPGSGTLVFRDVIGGGASETSAQSSMTSLPTAWRTGQSYPDGPISAYALSAGLGGTTPPPDTLPPSSVLGVAVSGATQTSVSLVWTPSSDNTAVAGYSVYRNGTLSGSTSSTSYGVSGLVCGTSYTFAVDAFDAAGNRSVRTSVTGSTAPCGDGTAPSVPATLSSSATQSSITLTWAASTDNVAVAGYGLYRNGTAVGSAVTTSYSFSGLTCGTTYTLAADAYDAAGNRSAKASLTAPTSACPPPSSGLANLWVDASGGSCVRQASPAGYVDSQACSWNQAYQASQTGDLILVKGGSYGNVSVGPNKASIGSPGVTFRTVSGESVVVGDFENGNISGTGGGSNITFAGPVSARSFRSDTANNIVVDGWRVDCGGCDGEQMFHIEQASNVTVRNSDISDNKNDSLMWINGSNLTFENNQIHDAGLPSGSGSHTECMYAQSVTNLTLKRNHFYHCSVMDVFITGSDVANGGYVENNVFEKPWMSTGVISNSALAFQFRNGGESFA